MIRPSIDSKMLPVAVLLASLAVSAFLFQWSPDAGLAPRDGEPSSVLAATTSIRWAGYSTTTYKGYIGGAWSIYGVKAGNQICNGTYSGSIWMDMDMLIKLGSQYPWTYDVWLSDFSGTELYDCFHFTDISASRYGSCASTQTTYIGSSLQCTCDVSKRIGCVYIP